VFPMPTRGPQTGASKFDLDGQEHIKHVMWNLSQTTNCYSGANQEAQVQVIRVALVISSLGPGGAERVLCDLANRLADRRYLVTLVTLSDVNSDFYIPHPMVRRIGLGVLGESNSIPKRIVNLVTRVVSLRNALMSWRPDIIISFADQTNVLTLLATLGTRLPVIISERTDPRLHRISRGWCVLRKLLYPRCAAMVAQTLSIGDWMKREYRLKSLRVIPNRALSPTEESDSERYEMEKPFLTSIGRLDQNKNFGLLIKAFAQIAPRHPEWHLVIVGEGPLRGELERLVNDLGLTGRVHLPGLVRSPKVILEQAELFVLPSKYEGFPNALLEAMAMGLPVISTDCCGPREIIDHNVNGILVPRGDVDALTGAIEELIKDPKKREALATEAQLVLERFNGEKIFQQWETLIEDLVIAKARK